ncbi:MAG: CBS domain-containing protein [Saprospiraceae bacterium]
MTAKNLITQSIVPLQTSDTGTEALQMMQVYHVRHLPIVNHEQLLGVLSEDDLLIHNTEDPIGTYRLTHVRPFCFENEHIFEIMTKLGRFQLTLIPVINADEVYLGVITMEDVLHYFAQQFSFSDTGSILVLESNKLNYSLSEIARIAESEDVTILSSFISHNPDDPTTYITLRLNRQDITFLKSTYERFGYTVFGSYSDEDFRDNLKERYDAFMSYLSI